MVNLRERVDILIRILFASAIALGCYFVVRPFLTAIIIAAIVTVVSWPMFKRFSTAMGNRPTPAALLMVTLLVVCLIIPTMFLSAAVAQQLPGAISGITEYIRTISAPDWVQEIPLIGSWLYSQLAVVFQPQALADYMKKMIDPITREVLTIAWALGNGLVQMGLVAFIAFFFYRDGDILASRAKEFLVKVSGELSHELSHILVNTTRSVVYGIVGTAAGQSLAACIGFIIVGAPGTLLLSVAVFILSVVPIGPPLVWGPVAVWLYAQGELGLALFMVAWGVLVVASVDNFIKPLLIARGSSLPLSLVFLGVFGGVIAFGFMGLILGPVLLAVGLAMIKTWLSQKARKRIAKDVSITFAMPKFDDKEPEQKAPEVKKNISPATQKNRPAPRRDHPRSFPNTKKKN